MTLYKADFLELHGEAVKSTAKKSTTKKTKKDIENVDVNVEERPVTGGKQLPDPVKKPKTEKQLAALERARENRKRKREDAEKAELEAVEVAKKAVLEKEAELLQKKLEQKEKRRLKKEAKQEAPTPSSVDEISEVVDGVVEKEVKVRKPKKAKVVNPSIEEPPVWFKKYIEGHEIEKNTLSKDKKSVTDIKKESKQVASQAWANDMTRDRVNQERDNHMSRMYSSIFGSKLH